jgi:hypothetical protein
MTSFYRQDLLKGCSKISLLWEFMHVIKPDDMDIIELLASHYQMHDTSISTLITSLEKVDNE